MRKIILQNILPSIFKNEKVSSEIWLNDLEFTKGKSYLIEADSGKGKSSLLSYILGYRDDYEGNIFFDDISLKTISPELWTSIRRRNVSMLFQELRLFPELTSWDNVQIKNKLTNYLSPKTIKEQFERLGISDKIDTKVEFMSYGQRQRLAFIRALAQPFDFLLLDEPVSHLDEDNAGVMSQMIKERMKETGAGLIVTSVGRILPMDYDERYKL